MNAAGRQRARLGYSAQVRIEEQQPLGARTTLGVGGAARFAAEAGAEDDVPAAVAWARERGLGWLAWGAGSNLLVSDAGFGGLAIHIGPRGVRFGEGGVVEAAAGEEWDALVRACVERGWAGVECLSGIPGTVGATPVQNVGAYGQELAEVVERVRAWDTRQSAWVELSATECGFGYRASRFNCADHGRFIVTAVQLRLRPGGAATVRYPELQRKLGGGTAGLADVRTAVLALRRSKGMVLDAEDADSRSAGSFFKNPIVAGGSVAAIARAAGAEPPRFAAGDGLVKIPAAWLIERAGFTKGYRIEGSRARLSRKHVLAIVNDGGASAAEVEALAQGIQRAVANRFGVELAREPEGVGHNRGRAR
jgi:UDP-N-acetylmuramate dehydrogenase